VAITTGQINDRGFKGLDFVNKRINLKAASWIEPQGSIVVFEDFLMDVLADDPLVTVTQAGTPTTAAAVDGTAGAPSAGHGGWVAGSVDNVDAEIDEVAIGGLGTGAGNPWMMPERAGNGLMVCEWGFVIPVALTARQYYAGLSDDPVEGTTTNGALNIQTAYTLVDVATDAAGWIFSSLATAPTIWKWASTLAGAGSTVAATTEGVTGVVDQYTVCRVEVDALGNAYFHQSISGATTNGRKDPTYRGTNALAVTPTVALLPMFSAAATTTTAVEWEIDYVFAATPR